MLLRRSSDCREIRAKDGCRLRELLHPDRGAPNLPYSLATARIGPGEATRPHRLQGEVEAYHFLEGTGRAHVGQESADVRAGDTLVVPQGVRQWVECTGDGPLRFLVVVSPPWSADHDVATA